MNAMSDIGGTIMKLSLVGSCVLHVALTAAAAQPSGIERFAEGRIALDKYKDCPAALGAFRSVEAQYQNDPAWLYYTSSAEACLKNYEEAYRLFSRYAKSHPTNIDVQDRLAEYSYLARKQREQTAARAEADAVATKKNAEQAAELKRRKTNVTGLWERQDGTKFRFRQDDNAEVWGYPVDAYQAGATMVDTGELVVMGDFRAGVLTGSIKNFFDRDIVNSCGQKSRRHDFRLTPSADGTHLSGEQDSVEYDRDCARTERTRGLSFSRVAK
jgi:hypothetical protein